MKITSLASGKMAEIVSNPKRKDKDLDTLMGAGFRYIKDGANKGEMVAKFSGGSNQTKFQRLRNALSGQRYLATEKDIKNIFRTAGMNEKQIAQAWTKVRPSGHGGFSAVDVKKQVSAFQFQDTKSSVKVWAAGEIKT